MLGPTLGGRRRQTLDHTHQTEPHGLGVEPMRLLDIFHRDCTVMDHLGTFHPGEAIAPRPDLPLSATRHNLTLYGYEADIANYFIAQTRCYKVRLSGCFAVIGWMGLVTVAGESP